MSMKTIRARNISLAVSDIDIREFFSFTGDIHYIEMKRESENTQLAYVTFKNSNAADMAVLLSGATIADLLVTITYADENYMLPPEALASTQEEKSAVNNSRIEKAEDVVRMMLAKGFILGKDVVKKAKAFDEQHEKLSNASATVASIEEKMGFTETSMVNENYSEMDKAGLEKAKNATSVITSNDYVIAGTSWISNAFSALTKAAADVTTMFND